MTTTFADGARPRIWVYTPSSRPGRVFWAYDLAVFVRFTQSWSDPNVQVVITSVNPASFPPIEMLANVVDALSEPTWLAITSPVRAPEQATKVNEVTECAATHNAG